MDTITDHTINCLTVWTPVVGYSTSPLGATPVTTKAWLERQFASSSYRAQTPSYSTRPCWRRGVVGLRWWGWRWSQHSCVFFVEDWVKVPFVVAWSFIITIEGLMGCRFADWGLWSHVGAFVLIIKLMEETQHTNKWMANKVNQRTDGLINPLLFCFCPTKICWNIGL